jgi:hypothetical protein
VFRFALASVFLFSIFLSSVVKAASLTSSATLRATVAACIPSTFNCDREQMDLSDPTSISSSLTSSITDASVPATYTVSYIGNASASFNGSVVSLQAHTFIQCGLLNCLAPGLGQSGGDAVAFLALSDQITFFTGLGGGFYEIVAADRPSIVLNGGVLATFQGAAFPRAGGVFNTAPMPFVDGVPFTLNVTDLAGAGACCDDNNDGGSASDEITLTLIALDSNQQPVMSLEYLDNTGIPYKFGQAEVGTLVPEPSTGILVLGAAVLVLCLRIARDKRRICT